MKKILSICIAAILLAGCLCACKSGTDNNSQSNEKREPIKIVASTFPAYSWIRSILGDDQVNAEVSFLIDDGVDLHSYQPTSEDIEKVSNCDMFVYVGGESDEWAEKILKQTKNKNMIVVNLLDELGDKIRDEETVEGMQEEEHEHEHDHDHEGDKDHEEAEKDEHVWLSLRNASSLVSVLSEKVKNLDPANAETYKANTDSYIKKLSDLDSRYKKAVSKASRKTLLFGDRFPFRYLTEDYGLSYYAAFAGCSSESEASFETITFLAKKVDELSVPVVLTIEGSDHKIAESIVKNTASKNQKILSMNSMQSVTLKEAEKGAEYIPIMEDNLAVLKKALN